MNTAKVTEKEQVVCGIIRDGTSNPLSINSESFKYKTNIAGNTYVRDGEDDYDVNKVGKNETENYYSTKTFK